MDDVLKSVPLVRDVLTLLQELTDLCERGGFKLTKFISNNKDVLLPIPDVLTSDGAKDKDLTSSLRTERALGLYGMLRMV